MNPTEWDPFGRRSSASRVITFVVRLAAEFDEDSLILLHCLRLMSFLLANSSSSRRSPASDSSPENHPNSLPSVHTASL